MTKSVLKTVPVLAVALCLWTTRLAQGGVTFTAVGSPQFDLVDVHLAAAPSNSFQLLFPKHFPRVEHDSFDQEVTTGMAQNGYTDKSVFNVSDFTDPSAVHLLFALVPNAGAPNGTTFDGNGPMIRNGTVIAERGDVYQNGVLFEAGPGAFSQDIGFQPADGFDGYSHFVVQAYENTGYARPGVSDFTGDYEYRITLRDPNDNGYDVLATFQIIPEPGTFSLFTLGAATALIAKSRWNSARRAAH